LFRLIRKRISGVAGFAARIYTTPGSEVRFWKVSLEDYHSLEVTSRMTARHLGTNDFLIM
jgi:hypothetical protein